MAAKKKVNGKTSKSPLDHALEIARKAKADAVNIPKKPVAVKGKKTVPAALDWGKGIPEDKLAYLNDEEMALLQAHRMFKGKRSYKGVPAFPDPKDTAAGEAGVSSGTVSGTTMGGGGSDSGNGGLGQGGQGSGSSDSSSSGTSTGTSSGTSSSSSTTSSAAPASSSTTSPGTEDDDTSAAAPTTPDTGGTDTGGGSATAPSAPAPTAPSAPAPSTTYSSPVTSAPSSVSTEGTLDRLSSGTSIIGNPSMEKDQSRVPSSSVDYSQTPVSNPNAGLGALPAQPGNPSGVAPSTTKYQDRLPSDDTSVATYSRLGTQPPSSPISVSQDAVDYRISPPQYGAENLGKPYGDAVPSIPGGVSSPVYSGLPNETVIGKNAGAYDPLGSVAAPTAPPQPYAPSDMRSPTRSISPLSGPNQGLGYSPAEPSEYSSIPSVGMSYAPPITAPQYTTIQSGPYVSQVQVDPTASTQTLGDTVTNALSSAYDYVGSLFPQGSVPPANYPGMSYGNPAAPGSPGTLSGSMSYESPTYDMTYGPQLPQNIAPAEGVQAAPPAMTVPGATFENPAIPGTPGAPDLSGFTYYQPPRYDPSYGPQLPVKSITDRISPYDPSYGPQLGAKLTYDRVSPEQRTFPGAVSPGGFTTPDMSISSGPLIQQPTAYEATALPQAAVGPTMPTAYGPMVSTADDPYNERYARAATYLGQVPETSIPESIPPATGEESIGGETISETPEDIAPATPAAVPPAAPAAPATSVTAPEEYVDVAPYDPYAPPTDQYVAPVDPYTLGDLAQPTNWTDAQRQAYMNSYASTDDREPIRYNESGFVRRDNGGGDGFRRRGRFGRNPYRGNEREFIPYDYLSTDYATLPPPPNPNITTYNDYSYYPYKSGGKVGDSVDAALRLARQSVVNRNKTR